MLKLPSAAVWASAGQQHNTSVKSNGVDVISPKLDTDKHKSDLNVPINHVLCCLVGHVGTFASSDIVKRFERQQEQ